MDDITSIIFDLGGVILDIDYKRTESAFQELGIPDFAKLYSQLRQDSLFDDLEMGLIDPQSFRERIRTFSRIPISDPQIDQAWNAILIGLPKENVDYLSSLKGKYRLFMLSNTNEIHEQAYRQLIQNHFGEYIFDSLFEKIYLSHRVHLRKPDVAIYNLVLRENDLDAAHTLFVDDSSQNIEGAKKAGLKTLWLQKGKKLQDLDSLYSK